MMMRKNGGFSNSGPVLVRGIKRPSRPFKTGSGYGRGPVGLRCVAVVLFSLGCQPVADPVIAFGHNGIQWPGSITTAATPKGTMLSTSRLINLFQSFRLDWVSVSGPELLT